jgi:K+-sensing histidine kinase KdpD
MSMVIRIFKRFGGYLTAVVGVGATTLIFLPFRLQVNSTTIALGLLVVVLFIATAWRSGPALLGSVLAALSFNYFFLPPYHTFTIAEPENWVAFGAFLVTALVAGQLSSYAGRRAEEAERLYAELESAFEKASHAEALRQSDQLKSALLDAVTHDLRTPLTAIKAAATTLIEDVTSDPSKEGSIRLDGQGRREFLDIINEETDRLNSFIGGMVDLARIEAGGLRVRGTWAQAEEIVENALDRARPRLVSNHVILKIERGLPMIRVDANAIAEVLYSLLDNAAKYSATDSQIRVAVSRADNDMIRFSVEDQGKGVAAERRELVFDKFFREPQADIHATGSGLGLGLSIARGIVESGGGRIWIEDGRDGYTTSIIFEIPIGDDEDNNGG